MCVPVDDPRYALVLVQDIEDDQADFTGLIPVQVDGHIDLGATGYIYIHCGNESQVDVYFDNLQVVASHGPLVEEFPGGSPALELNGYNTTAALQQTADFNGGIINSLSQWLKSWNTGPVITF